MEAAKNSICRSCRQKLATNTTSRSFSTSRTNRSVPPESPHYVDVPQSYQAYLPYTKRPKGILPVPRELFPASRPDKPSKQYLDNVAHDPHPSNIIPSSQMTSLQKHKSQMAELRRTQLREGLTNLHKRKQAEIHAMGKRSQAKQEQRQHLLDQAEREDARLTNVSVPKEMRPQSQNTLAALEAEVSVARRLHEQKLANLSKRTAEEKESKMDSLHTLYMNARKFITTEQQLNDLIHQQFDTSDKNADYLEREYMHADFRSEFSEGESMWNFGPPDRVKDMIMDATGQARAVPGMTYAKSATIARTRNEMEASKAQFRRDQERMRKIAEKLSGGKI